MATTLIDCVIRWRKRLEKSSDEDVILNTIRKLSKIPITPEILEATHIGKSIRMLSKKNDIIGEKAKSVLNNWRETIAGIQSVKKSNLTNVSAKENVNHISKTTSHPSPEYRHKKQASPDNKLKHQKRSLSNSSSQQSSKKLTGNSDGNNLIESSRSSPDNKLKHQKRSLSNSSSQQSSKKLTGNSDGNNLIESSHSFPDIKKTHLSHKGYDRTAKTSKDDSLHCSESVHHNKTIKAKSLVSFDSHEQSSLKRKLKVEEHVDSLTEPPSKKIKDSSRSNLESKKSHEKQDKHCFHKDVCKDSNSTSSLIKESNKHKSKKESFEKAKSPLNVKNKSKHSSKSNCAKPDKLEPKVTIHSSEEFTSVSASFEDCLGLNDYIPVNKKKSSKSSSSVKKPSTSIGSKSDRSTSRSPIQEVHEEHLPNSKEKIDSQSMKLKETDAYAENPSYCNLFFQDSNFYSPKKKEVLTNEDAIKFMSSRKEKTAVYSGRKNQKNSLSSVPTLFNICLQFLVENIDAIECLGEVPYFLLKPVLEKCTPIQLFKIENYNPYLLDDSNELWKIHCIRDYKSASRSEHETWRDVYLRSHDEHERKLKSVTANISASMSKSTPVRQIKLAYIDSVVKPPRDVARRQAKNGTVPAVSCKVKPAVSPVERASKPSSKATSKPSTSAVSSAPSSSTAAAASSPSYPPKKPKVPPLMAKALKSLKQYKRHR